MAKKKSAATTSKLTAKAAKKAKAAQKIEKKEKKKVSKKSTLDDDDDDDDLEGILEKMRTEWEAAHKVTEELVEGPPSRRANATLTACPNGAHIWCIGGEFFSEDGKAYFYNDVFRYTPEKDEWRKFVSPTCPGPRSAHAVVASPMGGGKIFLFGGEFSSLHQNSFHHYGDFWSFDVSTHSWDRIETKKRPSARSGHRMAMWKHYIILFGGFHDPGITTRYLGDLWVFDTHEYNWQQVEFREQDPKPSPRSGFSFLPCADGVILHGGYCKEYAKGKRPVGVMLEDTWLLRITLPDSTASGSSAASPTTTKSKGGEKPSAVLAPKFKWERRKRPSDAFAPSLRSGCTMTLWTAKSLGILFGGVTDEDKDEETLESVFWNDLYGYQLTEKGKWVSLELKRPKAPKAKAGKKKQERKGGELAQWERDLDSNEDVTKEMESTIPAVSSDIQVQDPTTTIPLPRYNAMLTVLRNILYIYGGIYERGSKEYTLDDFYFLQLDKLDRYHCLKESAVVIPDVEEESSSDDTGDEDDDDDDDDDEVEDDGDDIDDEDGDYFIGDKTEDGDTVSVVEEVPDGNRMANKPESKGDPKGSKTTKKSKRHEKREQDVETQQETSSKNEEGDIKLNAAPPEDKKELRSEAVNIPDTSKDTVRSEEDIISTPLPGETLAMFYARSREHWAQKAYEANETTISSQAKELRRGGFALASARYEEYKPMLAEVEKILAEAGLNEDEMRRGAAGGQGHGGVGQSRNRR